MEHHSMTFLTWNDVIPCQSLTFFSKFASAIPIKKKSGEEYLALFSETENHLKFILTKDLNL